MKEWIVPVVIAVIWILNAVLRNRENEEPVRVARGKAGERPDGRNPTSDIDRFLQEIERMKQKGAEPGAEPPKVVRASIPKVRPVNSSAPRVRAVGPRIKVATDVVPVVVERPGALPTRHVSQSPSLHTPVALPPVHKRVAPALAGLIQQLRSQQGVISAVVLNEILGPPKSMRR